MITGLQAFTQKHYQWFFGFLLVIIIASFIFAYGPASRLVEGKSPWHEGKLFLGYDLNNADVVRGLTRDASIGFFLKNGYPPYDSESFKSVVLQRILELAMADKLGIATPSTEQLGKYMTTLPAFSDDKGLFSRAKYDEFSKSFEAEGGAAFISERLAERWRLDQLETTFNSSSYYFPESLQREVALRTAHYDVVVATLSRPEKSDVTVTDAEAKAYFDAHASAYQTSEKRQGIYYYLPADKFTSRVETPSEEVLQKYFDKVSLKFIKWQKTENGQTTGDKPTPPIYAEHKEETLALYKQEKASRLAAEVVDEIVGKIYADKISPASPAWDELIKASGLSQLSLGPVSAKESVKDAPEDAVTILFALKSRPYSGAFRAETNGGFIYLKATQAPQPLSFEQAKAEVIQAATAEKADSQFVAESQKSAEMLKGATTLESFQKLAAEGNWKLEAPATFSLETPPASMSGQTQILQSLITASQNQVLTTTSGEQAQAVFVKSVTLPEFSLNSPEAREAKKLLDSAYGRMLSISSLNEWGEQQSKK